MREWAGELCVGTWRYGLLSIVTSISWALALQRLLHQPLQSAVLDVALGHGSPSTRPQLVGRAVSSTHADTTSRLAPPLHSWQRQARSRGRIAPCLLFSLLCQFLYYMVQSTQRQRSEREIDGGTEAQWNRMGPRVESSVDALLTLDMMCDVRRRHFPYILDDRRSIPHRSNTHLEIGPRCPWAPAAPSCICRHTRTPAAQSCPRAPPLLGSFWSVHNTGERGRGSRVGLESKMKLRTTVPV